MSRRFWTRALPVVLLVDALIAWVIYLLVRR